jgi:hypothetical protein
MAAADLDIEHAPYPSPLTWNEILKAIDSACLKATTCVDSSNVGDLNSPKLSWNRSKSPQQNGIGNKKSLLYGIVGTAIASSSTTSIPTAIVTTVTFYIAYCSWGGRILHIDQLQADDCDPSPMLVMYQILADISTNLQCRR